MYKIAVPLMASTINVHNRAQYAALCKQARAERIFLAIGSILSEIPATLADDVAYFKAQGFEVGVWTDTIGHGFVLSHVENQINGDKFSYMIDISGEERPHAYCPLHSDFVEYAAKHIAELAKTGVDIVMLDDDLRMSQHRGDLCCACPEHMKKIQEILGEEITLQQLRKYVRSGKANRYRDAWLQAQNEGMIAFVKAIRKKVDEETPNVTLCNCIACAPWNVDYMDVAQISRILAGKNPPILRLTGAPYWATRKRVYSLITVFEYARMLSGFMRGEDIQLISEGDVYPRPRYTCPASYLELYDAVTRIDGGYNGILKYMFDYVAGPDFERGYLKFHEKNAAFLDKLTTLFPGGANAGVRVVVKTHTMKDADLDLSSLDEYMPRPIDGTMLGSSGIPTVYHGKGICNSIFGENARSVHLSLLEDGVILDAVSAVILSERGVDVGMAGGGVWDRENIAFLCTEDREYKSFISDGMARTLSVRLSERARPVLFSTGNDEEKCMAYRYENAQGQRFLVFLFEGDSIFDVKTGCDSGLLKNYAVQRVLGEQIPWIARKPLPVYCEGNPQLYLMCAKEKDALSVAMFNCFADSVIQPVVALDGEYDKIECLNCAARLEGNKVILTETLHAFEGAAFRVYR